MAKKRRQKKAPKEMVIDGRELLLKHSHRAARATQVHRDKTAYNRRKEKQISQD